MSTSSRSSKPFEFSSIYLSTMYLLDKFSGVSASVHNRSRVTIKCTRAALTESITYMARGKVVQSEKRELASISRGKIRPGEKDEWVNEQLYIPPLPPTNLRGCHLIKIQYDVYVRKVMQFCNSIIIKCFIQILVHRRTKESTERCKTPVTDHDGYLSSTCR